MSPFTQFHLQIVCSCDIIIQDLMHQIEAVHVVVVEFLKVVLHQLLYAFRFLVVLCKATDEFIDFVVKIVKILTCDWFHQMNQGGAHRIDRIEFVIVLVHMLSVMRLLNMIS